MATFSPVASTQVGVISSGAVGIGGYVYAWGGMTVTGSYIPTAGAPATITDYSIDSAGCVLFAQAPLPGARLTWTGSYVRSQAQVVDLQSGNDLETAILISLFTDREANPGDVIPDGTGDARGWVGDQDQDYQIGSRLWLLSRAKQTLETLQRASDYIAEALQWLIDDGVVARFDITVEWTRPSMLGARIVAYSGDGAIVPMNFSWVWKAIN